MEKTMDASVKHPVSRPKGWVTGISWFMTAGVFFFAPLKFYPGTAFGFPPYSEKFVSWGYPEWFRYGVGATELLIGILLLLPRRRFLGAALYMFLMTGAVTTHIVNHEPFVPDTISATVHLVLSALVALATWPADWRDPFRTATLRSGT
jgi:uncharacterized membrane protein YphA (DoxX/SURF4 family)